MKIDFVKATGAGNDFVLIDNRSGEYALDWVQLAPRLCNRRYGIGADGILVVEKNANATFTMLYFNADGSYGGMCGNGGRCAALYVMDREHVSHVDFEALDYTYACERLSSEQLKLRMKDPTGLRMNIQLNLRHQKLKAHFINTGAPHVVMFLDELPDTILEGIYADGIVGIGRDVRQEAMFSPDGTNVNFVAIRDKDSIAIRTYERGVEDETLACGTGSVASAIISSIVRGATQPVTVHTWSKEQLKVSFRQEGEKLSEVHLEGPAKILFTGQIIL